MNYKVACLEVWKPNVRVTSEMRETCHQIKEGAVLINTARGGIADDKTLVAALLSGNLRGADLNAFGLEPRHIGGWGDNVAPVAQHVFTNLTKFTSRINFSRRLDHCPNPLD